MSQQLIGYYRVSTAKQGRSGLGLEAQVATVAVYARETGGELIAGYTEVESGRKSDRPELDKAIDHGRFARATLIIAKMDRLTRDLKFLIKLEDGRVDFKACDMPHANKVMLRFMITMAEYEAEMASVRTKAAWAAKRARGDLCGAEIPACRNLTHEGSLKGAKAAGMVRAERAQKWNKHVVPRLQGMRSEGLTLRAIADVLNAEKTKPYRGKAWSHVQVWNLLKRYPEATTLRGEETPRA
jgi:DNA invertase Pin-like site-specific DNA recombinase